MPGASDRRAADKRAADDGGAEDGAAEDLAGEDRPADDEAPADRAAGHRLDDDRASRETPEMASPDDERRAEGRVAVKRVVEHRKRGGGVAGGIGIVCGADGGRALLRLVEVALEPLDPRVQLDLAPRGDLFARDRRGNRADTLLFEPLDVLHAGGPLDVAVVDHALLVDPLVDVRARGERRRESSCRNSPGEEECDPHKPHDPPFASRCQRALRPKCKQMYIKAGPAGSAA